MKKINIITAVLLLLAMNVWSQRVTITPTANSPLTVNYNFNLLAQGYPQDINVLRPQDTLKAWVPSKEQKASSVFIEFGDGTFGFNASGTHAYNNYTLTYPIVTKAAILYEDEKKPPRHTLTDGAAAGLRIDAGDTTAARGVMSPAVLTTGGANIKITPNINSVVPGDTMIFVVTYRIAQKAVAQPVLRFSYNNNNINAFYPLTSPAAPVTFDTLWAPHVRMYHGEKVTASGKLKPGFGNGLYFSDLNPDGAEHHVFITLVPDSTFTGTAEDLKNAIKTEAEILDETGKSLESAFTQMDGGLLAHDPNYIAISPGCNLLPKKGKLLTFKIHCQNEGLGYAKKVVIKVGLPPGVHSNDIKAFNKYNSTAPYGRKGTWDFTEPDSVKITFDLTNDHNPLHTLKGVHNNPCWRHDPATMADAWFTIPAKNSMPNLIQAAANIYFYNFDNSKNAPVTTNTGEAKFSDCCGKGCRKYKKKFWRWLFYTRC